MKARLSGAHAGRDDGGASAASDRRKRTFTRRGRNAKSPTMAKNATMSDYRKATGFETLMGWLYLQDEFERLVELVKTGVDGLHLKL